MAAKAWPQQAWFLKVICVMWKSLSSVASARSQSGSPPIARPKPASPSMISSDPVRPSAAARAAVTPASAARPACMGLDIESARNACCRPAEKVAPRSVPSRAWRGRDASHRGPAPRRERAGAAPPEEPRLREATRRTNRSPRVWRGAAHWARWAACDSHRQTARNALPRTWDEHPPQRFSIHCQQGRLQLNAVPEILHPEILVRTVLIVVVIGDGNLDRVRPEYVDDHVERNAA